MRILYTHYHTDQAHPAVQMVEHISRELREFGHEVLVHASAGLKPKQPAESSSAITTESRNPKFKQRCKQLLWFAKAMSRNRKWLENDLRVIRDYAPDVVLSRQDAYCWSVTKASKQLGIPLVTYADAPVAYETREFNHEQRWHPPGLVEFIERWNLKNSRAVLTVSRPAAKRLRMYGLRTPIHVNHNGIETERFREFKVVNNLRCDVVNDTPSGAGEHTREVELARSKELILGFQGTFKSFHGVDRLRELMLWSATRPNLRWLLIGDGPERQELEQAVKGKVKADFVGRQSPCQMPRLLSEIDIAIAPHSQMSGDFYFCPLKILEYAACGCAVVASNQGDIPLLLANGHAGEIVGDDHLDSWTTAVDKLIEDESYRKDLGNKARNHILDNLTWQHTARRAEAVLYDALGVTPPRDKYEAQELEGQIHEPSVQEPLGAGA